MDQIAQSFSALKKFACARAQRSQSIFWAPLALALNFPRVLRSRSRSVSNERRSILRSISKTFAGFEKHKSMHFYNFWLPVQKSEFKAEKRIKIEEILEKMY